MSDGPESRNEWVTRVLGVSFGPVKPSSPGKDVGARLRGSRPRGRPPTAMTGNVLGMLSRAQADSPQEVPGVLAGMIPRFLLAMQNEPQMGAKPLERGAPVPSEDRLLTVADSLNTVMRSARRWEALLKEAEAANRMIDELERSERDETKQKQYETLVTSYNATRMAALSEEERCNALVAALAAEYRASQGGRP